MTKLLCSMCEKQFYSRKGFEQHNMAKHAAKAEPEPFGDREYFRKQVKRLGQVIAERDAEILRLRLLNATTETET